MTTGEQAYLRFREQFIALDPKRYPADYIDAQVWAGFWRCFGNQQAAILCELKRYPSGVVEVAGWGAAGELPAIIELIAVAEEWGRANGARAAEIDSTAGWSRALEKHGYTPVKLTIRKEW